MVAKEFYTPEEYAAAKEADIAAFLTSIGYELTRAGHCRQGKLHDSLIIRDDGRWYWNSRGLHGNSSIELYKQILLNDFGYSDELAAAIAAIKQLAAGRGTYAVSDARLREPSARLPGESLTLPAPFRNNNRVMAYLCHFRGLDAEIARGLVKSGKIYESADYHNAVFVAFDKDGRPRNAFLRGALSKSGRAFKRDLDGSDKSYSFSLRGHPDSYRAYVFESAIDAISHATICKINGEDWRDGYRVSLGGTSFLGLDRFLAENPNISMIAACLDNDPAGVRASAKLADEYSARGYSVMRESPEHKDFNEDLLNLRERVNAQGFER
ncbi:MAG: DUF3991 and toprim domain-containing protein [Clostridiales bacterium]|jgi:hypothetical protein|nr:DUF3991 and toprim domain-containing protein [Clostridiales bacterium]